MFVIRNYTGGAMSKITFVVIITFMLSTANMSDAKIGITWGNKMAGSLVPSMMVDMLLQSGITENRFDNIT
jgi:hypothetical protein